jgi:hypothetical protein
MSSGGSNTVTTPLGVVLPASIAEIVEDFNRHPERGRLLDLINAHSRRINSQTPTTKKKRSYKKRETATSSNIFTLQSCTPGGTPIIGASIGLCSNDGVNPTDCNGYVVSLLPSDASLAVVVLEIPNRDMIPCLCPTALLDDAAIKEAEALMNRLRDDRKGRYCRSANSISVKSIPARRGDVQGHLLLTGPKTIKGRVVDARMLESLKAGCLRIGDHAQSIGHSYYTLDRLLSVNRGNLKNTVHLLLNSSSGIRLCLAGPVEVGKIIGWGQSEIENRLEYWHSLREAINALHQASNLPAPSIDERVLQVAIGGDSADSMTVGKFIPCQGRRCNPWCACDFTVDDDQKEGVKEMLRCRC